MNFSSKQSIKRDKPYWTRHLKARKGIQNLCDFNFCKYLELRVVHICSAPIHKTLLIKWCLGIVLNWLQMFNWRKIIKLVGLYSKPNYCAKHLLFVWQQVIAALTHTLHKPYICSHFCQYSSFFTKNCTHDYSVLHLNLEVFLSDFFEEITQFFSSFSVVFFLSNHVRKKLEIQFLIRLYLSNTTKW